MAGKPTDHKRESELAIHRLQVRKEMKSADLDEDSNVIEQEAHSRHAKSDPAPVKGLVAVLRELPPWGRVVVILALLAALSFGGLAAKVAGWF